MTSPRLAVGLLLASGALTLPPMAIAVDTPLGSGITYQGLLAFGGVATQGTCDMRFRLWDSLSDGTQVGSTQDVAAVAVERGTFTVVLDDAGQFGATAFTGAERFLEIAVRCPAGGGTYTTLAPRQRLTAAAYARYSLSASSVHGQAVSATPPSPGQILQWNGSEWVGATLRPRGYYQTSATVAGNAALTACAAGYHMANFAEIFNTSALRYAAEVAGAAHGQDSGSGPPFSITGWVRTGVGGATNNQAGAGNCSLWTSNNAGHYGTTVGLNPGWLLAAVNISPWDGIATTCNTPRRVWCVQD